MSADDLAACVKLDGPLDHDPRHRYVVGLDLGLKNDRTVLTVCHAEPDPDAPPGGLPRVVLDRLAVLAGTRERPVQLADVEALALEAARAYTAPIRLDPWQAVGLAQRLRSRGVVVEEWSFTPASVGRLASTLHLLLREHRLALPDDADLLSELATVRLRETTPGVFRLDHDAGAARRPGGVAGARCPGPDRAPAYGPGLGHSAERSRRREGQAPRRSPGPAASAGGRPGRKAWPSGSARRRDRRRARST